MSGRVASTVRDPAPTGQRVGAGGVLRVGWLRYVRRNGLLVLSILLLVAPVVVAGPIVAYRVALRQPSTERAHFEREVVDDPPDTGGFMAKAFGDMDGDGLTDIVAAHRGEGLVLYRGPSWTRQVLSPDRHAEQAHAVDVDGDGDLDIVLGGIDAPARWFENPLLSGRTMANSSWTEHPIGGTNSHDCEVSDIDVDGRPDVATSDGVWLQRAPNSWTFLDNTFFPGRGGHGTALGDVDGDGYTDLVDVTGSTPSFLVWYENPLSRGRDPSTEAWRRILIGPGFAAASISIADLTGDGRNDILLASETSHGGLMLLKASADASGAAWTRQMIDPTVNLVHQSSIKVGDVDGDGTLDVAVSEMEESLTGRVSVYFNTAPDGSMWVRQVVSSSGGVNLKMVDIDGDGDLDILNANHGNFGVPTPLEIFRNVRSVFL